MPEAEIESRMHIYGDEDGDTWYAAGHWTSAEMIEAAMKWEAEVADPIERSGFDTVNHSQYWVIDDPENWERYKVVGRDHEGAQPMTMIVRV